MPLLDILAPYISGKNDVEPAPYPPTFCDLHYVFGPFGCKMSRPNTRVDVKQCAKIEPIHPCDPSLPCDPFFEENDCPTPYVCQERLKNPAYPGEMTTCRSGAFMHVKACKKVEPPHICDSLTPCSEVVHEEHAKKPRCAEPPMCYERVKNPESSKKIEPCDPTK